MTAGVRRQEHEEATFGELTVRASVLVAVVTFLIMVALPAIWAIAASHA